jgi:hypothetical protein
MSSPPNTGGSSPHELVRELEAAIAARLAAAGQARDEVASAQRQAEDLTAEAEVRASEAARRRRAAILSAAHAEAGRLTQAGIDGAAALSLAAARRRDDDVALVMSQVLPKRTRSPRDEASRP